MAFAPGFNPLAALMGRRQQATPNPIVAGPDPARMQLNQALMARQLSQQPRSGFGALSNLAGTALLAYQGRKMRQQQQQAQAARGQALAQALAAGGSPQQLAQRMMASGAPPAQAIELATAMAKLQPEAAEQFEVIKDPYGMGGVGQRSTRTGKIVNYQPAKEEPGQFETVTDPFGRGGVFQRDPKTGKMTQLLAPPKKEKDEEEPKMLKTARHIRELRQSADPDAKRAADALEMGMLFGGKPPEAYVKARGNLDMARTMTGKLYTLIRDAKANPIVPDQRAELNQAHSALVLAFADLQNRGANFTETEQALIQGMLGGDPTSMMGRTLRTRQSYLDRLKEVGKIIEQRGQGLLQAYTSPGLEAPVYPWEQEAAATGQVPTEAGAEVVPPSAAPAAPEGAGALPTLPDAEFRRQAEQALANRDQLDDETLALYAQEWERRGF